MAEIQIGELAAIAGMSLATLRHYDEVGLVSPSRRSPGGFRLYSEADVERLLLIRRMKPLGYSVDEMRQVLLAVDELERGGAVSDEALSRLDDILAGARDRRADLARKLGMADEFIDLLRTRVEHLARRPDPTLR